jgi:putative membrane-bound dehydrogenase-like protein
MYRRWYVLAGVLALPLCLPLTMAGRQAQAPAAAPLPPPVRIEAAEAARLAKEIRGKVNVELPPGIELSLWAPDHFVNDPIAIDVDARGTVYATSSTRNNMPLDIRGHPDWVPIVHTLRSVEDLRAFYQKVMAPERSAANGWIQDLNKDGSRDIRDLTELKERIHRLQDTDGDGLADVSQIVAEGFNQDPTWDVAGGILSHEGDLFFGTPPGVYRLKDTNGDGTIDQQTTVMDGFNTHPAFGGHGVSGVMMGPDGRLYWEVGDIGLNVVDKTGKRWVYPNQGAVLRSELDGSGFEVFATGIRNLQEFSFDEHGNLISVDNDGDHQGESERVVYIPYGSDSGWRSNWQYGKYTDPKNNRYNVWMDERLFRPRHAGQSTHIIPPVSLWHAGPSGMVYNPGTALSEEWRNHFFVSSFPGAPSGARVYGFTLKPEGAGFAMGPEKQLLRGILTVGMQFGPEGALYLTDWITGWDSKNNGRIWKLDAPAAAGTPIRKEVQGLLQEDFAKKSAADVSALLRHADMRIRQKAQFDLVRRGDVKALTAAASGADNGLARMHGIWGIAQLARKDAGQASNLAALLGDADPEVRAQAAKMIGDVRYAASGEALVPLLKDSAPRVRFFAAEALGRIAHKPAGPALVEMVAANDDQDVYLRHAGALALASIGDRQALAALSTHSSRAVRIAAIVALRRLQDPGLARFLADADETVVTEAARGINDDGGIPGALADLGRLVGEARFTSEPLLRRAISASLRTGTADAAERVAALAASDARPQPLRVEAIAALGVWAEPSPMDRVDGYYLEQTKTPRDSAAARAAVQKLITSIPAGAAAPMKVALADAAGRLQIKEAVPVLQAQLRQDPAAEVRLASLGALRAIGTGSMDELMQVALADKDPAVRRAALGLLPGLSMSEAAKAQHLAGLIKTGSTPEKQGALQVLGTMKSPEARKLLAGYVAELTTGKTPPELQVDVLTAAQASGDTKLEAQLETYQKSRKADTLVDAFREGLLAGGEARRGREVFSENPAAECTRCHALGGRGADVGPSLTNIASTLTREQLLEALLNPNARIAPGFGTVSVTLKNGQRVDGTLREETPAELVLMVGTPAVERRVPKTEIAERTNAVSAMPPFGLILQPRDIRDLVAFLSTLK